MNKKLLIITILLSMIFVQTVRAESCYISLNIKEAKVGDKINLSLQDQENIYADAEGSIKPLAQDEDYVLNVYDKNNQLINQYALYSARFLFVDTDDPENPGGMIEGDQGIINSIIPYDEEIGKITVSYNSTETDLKVNIADLKCKRTCKIENEKGNYNTDRCCSGFVSADKGDDNFVCIKCGDNVCSNNEDIFSCPADCDSSAVVGETSSEDKGGKLWIMVLSIALILLVVLVFIIILIIKKRSSAPPVI